MRARLVAAVGVCLLVMGLALAALRTGDSTAAPIYKVMLPGLAGDDASGLTYATPVPTTPTPAGTPTITPTPTPVAGSCSYSRVAVKTLGDAAAAFDRTPLAVGVSALHLIKRPEGITEARVPASETTIYTLPVELTSMQENASREIVLLVSDPANVKAMLVYFPHKDCLKNVTELDKGMMIKARADLLAACGQPSQYGAKLIRGRATITGAAFWGAQGVPGAAPNGMEIHPVTAFTYNSAATCDPNDASATPPPTPTPAAVLNRVVVTISGGANQHFHRGESITVTGQTEPAIPGLGCVIKYYKVSDQVEQQPIDLGLPGMTTGGDGRVEWTFNIPGDSPFGRGTIEIDCADKAGNNNYWVDP